MVRHARHDRTTRRGTWRGCPRDVGRRFVSAVSAPRRRHRPARHGRPSRRQGGTAGRIYAGQRRLGGYHDLWIRGARSHAASGEGSHRPRRPDDPRPADDRQPRGGGSRTGRGDRRRHRGRHQAQHHTLRSPTAADGSGLRPGSAAPGHFRHRAHRLRDRPGRRHSPRPLAERRRRRRVDARNLQRPGADPSSDRGAPKRAWRPQRRRGLSRDGRRGLLGVWPSGAARPHHHVLAGGGGPGVAGARRGGRTGGTPAPLGGVCSPAGPLDPHRSPRPGRRRP